MEVRGQILREYPRWRNTVLGAQDDGCSTNSAERFELRVSAWRVRGGAVSAGSFFDGDADQGGQAAPPRFGRTAKGF